MRPVAVLVQEVDTANCLHQPMFQVFAMPDTTVKVVQMLAGQHFRQSQRLQVVYARKEGIARQAAKVVFFVLRERFSQVSVLPIFHIAGNVLPDTTVQLPDQQFQQEQGHAYQGITAPVETALQLHWCVRQARFVYLAARDLLPAQVGRTATLLVPVPAFRALSITSARVEVSHRHCATSLMCVRQELPTQQCVPTGRTPQQKLLP